MGKKSTALKDLKGLIHALEVGVILASLFVVFSTTHF
jgi:hypothetical protein